METFDGDNIFFFFFSCVFFLPLYGDKKKRRNQFEMKNESRRVFSTNSIKKFLHYSRVGMVWRGEKRKAKGGDTEHRRGLELTMIIKIVDVVRRNDLPKVLFHIKSFPSMEDIRHKSRVLKLDAIYRVIFSHSVLGTHKKGEKRHPVSRLFIVIFFPHEEGGEVENLATSCFV